MIFNDDKASLEEAFLIQKLNKANASINKDYVIKEKELYKEVINYIISNCDYLCVATGNGYKRYFKETEFITVFKQYKHALEEAFKNKNFSAVDAIAQDISKYYIYLVWDDFCAECNKSNTVRIKEVSD